MSKEPDRWLTVFEVLDRTQLPYAEILRLAEDGRIGTRSSGSAVLYAAADVERLAASPAP